MAMASTIAYYNSSTITAAQCFIVQALGAFYLRLDLNTVLDISATLI